MQLDEELSLQPHFPTCTMNGKLLLLLSGRQNLPGYSKNLSLQGQRSPARQTFCSLSPTTQPTSYTASPFLGKHSSLLKFSPPMTNPQSLLRATQREGSLPQYADTPPPRRHSSLMGEKREKRKSITYSLPFCTLAKPISWLWEDFLPLFEASGQNPPHSLTALVCPRSHSPPAPGPRRQRPQHLPQEHRGQE